MTGNPPTSETAPESQAKSRRWNWRPKLRWFASEREFDIHNKNNTFFVDELFSSLIFRRGLFFFRGGATTTISASNESDSVLTDAFHGGYAEDADPIWSLPDNSSEWATVKGQLLIRVRISGYALQRAEALLEETHELKDAVDVELARR